MATQTLNQLAADYVNEFPDTSETILRDCYVVDI